MTTQRREHGIDTTGDSFVVEALRLELAELQLAARLLRCRGLHDAADAVERAANKLGWDVAEQEADEAMQALAGRIVDDEPIDEDERWTVTGEDEGLCLA